MIPLFQQAPTSLCILRLSAIGDVCQALAAVQQIQRHWPQTEITWIVGKVESQLLANIPHIKVITYDKKTGWLGVVRLWNLLKDKQFDALLMMQTALRASVLSLGIKAKYKIGFGVQREREMQRLFINQRISEPQNPHVLSGFIGFANYLGVPTFEPQWDFYITESERQSILPFIDVERKNLIIAPCSSKAEKDWQIERYAAVANYAHQQNMNVIFCASSSLREKQIVSQIIALCQFEPIDLSGKTTLRQLLALIEQVDLVISPDSAAAHLASAVNTPVIGLYAYHNPQRTGPYCYLERVVSVYEQNAQKEFGKSPNQLPWATKLKGKNLMAQIQVTEVIAQMNGLIQS